MRSRTRTHFPHPLTGLSTKAEDFVGVSINRWTILSVGGPPVGKFAKRVLSDKEVLVRCACGTVKTSRLSYIISQRSKSCGCYSEEVSRSNCLANPPMPPLPRGQAAANTLYSEYRSKALARGLEFSISRDEFKSITSRECSYCGAPPSCRKKKWAASGDYIYNGIDRVDNTLGYIASNVVACCVTCNRAKNTLTLQEFTSWVERVYERICRGVANT